MEAALPYRVLKAGGFLFTNEGGELAFLPGDVMAARGFFFQLFAITLGWGILYWKLKAK